MSGNVGSDLKIDVTDIDNEIVRQPGLMAWYGEELRKKKTAARKAKLNLDVYEAALDQKFRDQYVARGKKVTEREIETQIRQHPDWQRKKSDLIDLETETEQMEQLLWALVQKKEMLITYCANQRQERTAGFSMKEQPEGEQRYSFPPATNGGFSS